MGWTFVQVKDSTSNTAQFSSNTTTGNQIVVVNNAGATGGSSVAISPGSGTFTKIVTLSANSTETSEIWLCPNVTGGTTPTVTMTGGTSDGITAYEFSGGDTGGGTDGTNSGSSALTTALTTNSITTTVNGDLVVKGFSCGGSPNGTAESGWTEINPNANANVSGYIVQSSSGAITGTDTQTNASYAGVIAALKPASGGSTVTLPSTTMKGLLGITSSTLKGLIAGGSVVHMQAALGITSANLKGLISGGSTVQIQGKLGITTATLKSLLAGGSVVPLKAAFGIAGQIGKLARSLATLQASMGIVNAGLSVPGSVLTGGTPPVAVPVAYAMWGGGHSSGNL